MTHRYHARNWLLLVFMLAVLPTVRGGSFLPSGSADIDAARKSVAVSATTPENHRERCLMLFMWLGALQQQGADTRSFFELDREYYRLEPQLNRLKDGQPSPALKQMCEFVDRAYQAMEEIRDTADLEVCATPSPRRTPAIY